MTRRGNLDLFDRPSTADDGKRSELDRYYTPAWMTRALLAHQAIDREAIILEPAAGDLAIARELVRQGFTNVITNDVDKRQPTDWHCDARDELWSSPDVVFPERPDWVISNLPFNIALPILDQAWLYARVGVAMLLRKTFAEPTGKVDNPKLEDRGPWLKAHPPQRVIGLPRYPFRGKGSDSVSCDWFIWLKDSAALIRSGEAPFVIVDDHERLQYERPDWKLAA